MKWLMVFFICNGVWLSLWLWMGARLDDAQATIKELRHRLKDKEGEHDGEQECE